MSLADDLLSEAAPKAKPKVSAPVPKRRQRTVGRSIKPARTVRESLQEAVKANRQVQLTVEQARGLCVLLERMDDDPFLTGGAGRISTDDLRDLGLKMADSTPEEEELGDPFKDPEDRERDRELDLEVCYTANNEDPIPASAAIVAPDATPGGDEDIPIEVVKAMQALVSDDEEVPMGTGAGSPDGGSFGGGLRQELADVMGGDDAPDGQIEPDEEPDEEEAPDTNLAVSLKRKMSDSIKRNPATASTHIVEGGQDMRSTMNRWRGARKGNSSESDKQQKKADFLARLGQLG